MIWYRCKIWSLPLARIFLLNKGLKNWIQKGDWKISMVLSGATNVYYRKILSSIWIFKTVIITIYYQILLFGFKFLVKCLVNIHSFYIFIVKILYILLYIYCIFGLFFNLFYSIIHLILAIIYFFFFFHDLNFNTIIYMYYIP